MGWEWIAPVFLAMIALISGLLKILHTEAMRTLRKGFADVAESNDRHNDDARGRAKKARRLMRKNQKKTRKTLKKLAAKFDSMNGTPHADKPAEVKR
jgi:hypothetical protein